MFDIIIGEKVINKQGETGTIISSDDSFIYSYLRKVNKKVNLYNLQFFQRL